MKGLQGREMRMVASGADPRGAVTAFRLGKLTQGKPWAKLSWPFGPQTATLSNYRAS